jgi:hypothetical protein
MSYDEQPDAPLHGECAAEIESLNAKVVALEAENRILTVKTTNSLANNLCPDHRDKQAMKPCLACTIEKLEAENYQMDVLYGEEFNRNNDLVRERAALRQQLLAAQGEVKRLRFDMFNTASACRIWGGEAERARTMLEGSLSTPFDTSALDALMKNAERYRLLREFAHECSCSEGHINSCVSISMEAWIEGQSSSETLDAAIDAAIQEAKP